MSRITQRGATGPISIVANGSFQTSTDASLETLVGTRWDLSDGREVMLVQAGAVNLAAGVHVQDAALVANHQNLAVTAFQAYSANGNVPAKVTATLGGTAATANQYAGGFLVVNDEAGEGQTLRIASNTAQANGAGSIVITLEDSPSVAITTASEVSLIPAHGNGVIIFPTTATNVSAGVTLYPLLASEYGFTTVKGTTSVLNDGTPATGAALSPSNATAGALEGAVLAQGIVGTAQQTFVSGEYRSAFINV